MSRRRIGQEEFGFVLAGNHSESNSQYRLIFLLDESLPIELPQGGQVRKNPKIAACEAARHLSPGRSMGSMRWIRHGPNKLSE
jgi:hypothetical protein